MKLLFRVYGVVWCRVVPHSCDNKPQLGIGWLAWAELGNTRKSNPPLLSWWVLASTVSLVLWFNYNFWFWPWAWTMQNKTFLKQKAYYVFFTWPNIGIKKHCIGITCPLTVCAGLEYIFLDDSASPLNILQYSSVIWRCSLTIVFIHLWINLMFR